MINTPDAQIAEEERIATLIVGARNLEGAKAEFGVGGACRILKGLGKLKDTKLARDVAFALAQVLLDSEHRVRLNSAKALCKVIGTARQRGSEEDSEALETLTADIGFHELVRQARALAKTTAEAGAFVKLLAMIGDETAAKEVCDLFLGIGRDGTLKARNWGGTNSAKEAMKYLSSEDIVPVVCACARTNASSTSGWMFATPEILKLAFRCKLKDISHIKLERDAMAEFGFGLAAIAMEARRLRLTNIEQIGLANLSELKSALLDQAGLPNGEIGDWVATGNLRIVWRRGDAAGGRNVVSEAAVRSIGGEPTTACGPSIVIRKMMPQPH